jgi:alanine dehydrogenase
VIALGRSDVAALLPMDDCIAAVEDAFRLHGEGKLAPPGVLGVPSVAGGFHLKAAIVPRGRSYFAAKVNGNFSGNPRERGLPTIQGVVVLCDALDGRPLAVLDSIEITLLRTAAATAVAAKRLARPASRVAAICGCGVQGRAQLLALTRVLRLERALAFDADFARAEEFAKELAPALGLQITAVREVAEAMAASDVCVTCTPARTPFLRPEHVRPGTFIAAVGADSADKQELDARLVARSKLVVDVLGQCAAIGELHHALDAQLMTVERVHAELGQVIAGKRAGRESDDEVIVFDSTGTALQDAASAALVYERAVERGAGTLIALA